MHSQRCSSAVLVAVAAAASLWSGCLSAPSEDTSAPPAGLDRDGPQRAARAATLRIRVHACDGIGVGSGFALRRHVVVTNRHVVEEALDVEVSTWDGRTLDGKSVSVSPSSDLAVVRVTEALPRVARLGDDDPLPGDEVSALGYPLGSEFHAAVGKVLGYARHEELGPFARAIWTDVFVRRGNSGGPLVGSGARVVGVVFARHPVSRAALAIPLSELEVFARNLDELSAVQPICALAPPAP